MGFVCQINFQDSFDLVGPDLPGDLLLIFAQVASYRDGHSSISLDEYDHSTFEFRWMKAGRVRQPITHLPQTGLDLWPLHGIIHRTFDVSESDYHALECRGCLDMNNPLYQQSFPPAIWKATKISGLPYWEQGVDLGMTPKLASFLCQMRSDDSSVGEPDPYVGHCGPMVGNPFDLTRHQLRIGDLGSVYLFVDNGRIDVRTQS